MGLLKAEIPAKVEGHPTLPQPLIPSQKHAAAYSTTYRSGTNVCVSTGGLT
jgi:hypothetical protein